VQACTERALGMATSAEPVLVCWDLIRNLKCWRDAFAQHLVVLREERRED
jgi:hypothetical protein